MERMSANPSNGVATLVVRARHSLMNFSMPTRSASPCTVGHDFAEFGGVEFALPAADHSDHSTPPAA
jgi:hypothetical protein